MRINKRKKKGLTLKERKERVREIAREKGLPPVRLVPKEVLRKKS